MTERSVPAIFNRLQAKAKWSRARDRQKLGDAASYLADTMAEDILDRLDFMRFEAESPLIVGDTTKMIKHAMAERGTKGTFAYLDEFDEESPGPHAHYDLIIHLMGLGMVNDLPGALIHARHSLKEGGLFLAAFPGAGSLPTLRQITLAADGDRPSARIHPQIDSRAGTALLQRAGFARQVVDSFPLKVRFSSFGQLVSDLRDHGLTRSLTSPAPPLSRAWLKRAETQFDAMREEDGKVTETFEILVMTGWR